MKQTEMRRRHVRDTCARPLRVEASARAAGDTESALVAGEKERRHQGIILVAVDFSQSSSKAMDQVLGLAERLSKSIVLLHVVEPFYGRWFIDSSKREANEAEANQMALQKLEAMLSPQRSVRPSITCIVRNGLPEYEILRAAESLGADLIVLGRRPRNPLHFFIFGSNTHDVIDCASCPVLVLNHMADAACWQ